MTKICRKCKIPKELEQFGNRKIEKDGKHYYCKSCLKDIFQENKEQILVKQKIYLQNEDVLERRTNYNINYNINNKDKIQEWLNKNPEYHNSYNKNKRKTNINYKLSQNLRKRLYDALRGKNKSISALILLSCSVDEFKEYIESKFISGMTWENQSIVWEIDHIRPCASFNLEDIEQQKECFHYSNHQPLFKTTSIAESFGHINQIGNRNKKDKLIEK